MLKQIGIVILILIGILSMFILFVFLDVKGLDYKYYIGIAVKTNYSPSQTYNGVGYTSNGKYIIDSHTSEEDFIIFAKEFDSNKTEEISVNKDEYFSIQQNDTIQWSGMYGRISGHFYLNKIHKYKSAAE